MLSKHNRTTTEQKSNESKQRTEQKSSISKSVMKIRDSAKVGDLKRLARDVEMRL